MTFITLNTLASGKQADYYFIHGSMKLLAVKQDNGYKLKEKNGVVISNTYDKIYGYYTYSGWENPVVVVYSEGNFGLIDAVNGKEVLSPADSPITSFTDAVYAPEPLVWNIGGKKETLSSKPINTQAPWMYRNELNPIMHYYTWDSETYLLGSPRVGFRDGAENDIFLTEYHRLISFADGIVIVEKDYKAGAINTKGELIVPCQYDLVRHSGNLLIVYKLKYPEQNAKGAFLYESDIRWFPALKGFFDHNGKTIVPCEYDNVDFEGYTTPHNTDQAGLFRVRKTVSNGLSLYGLIDLNGKEVLPVKYPYIDKDNFGRYILGDSPSGGSLRGMADNSGIIIPMIYENIYSSMVDPNYIIVMQNGKCGMLTPGNKVLIRPNKYESIYLTPAHGKLFFFAGLAGKWGRINSTGKILLIPKYERITPYQEKDDNSMVVLFEGQWMRIDGKGNLIEAYEKDPYEIEEAEIIPLIKVY